MDVARLEGDEDMEAANAWSIAHGVDRIEDMGQRQLRRSRMWPHVASSFLTWYDSNGALDVWVERWSSGRCVHVLV